MWTYVIIHLSKSMEYTISRINPNVNHRLWLIIICQCWFTDCNKCVTVVQDGNSGGGFVFVKAEGNVNSVSLLLTFADNLKCYKKTGSINRHTLIQTATTMHLNSTPKTEYKYLGINAPKYIQNLYVIYYKILMQEINKT